MKICNRGLNFVQVLGNGDVRLCAWNYDNVIGNLLEQDFYDIYHSERAKEIRESLINGTYRYCPVDRCPFLANGTMSEEQVELDEIPDYPDELYLAYDRTCNYRCTSCINCNPVPETYKNNIAVIEKKLEPVLKKIRKIGANGEGELFASPSILKLLRNWKPEAPANEISVSLETNGSLFTPENWEKISNLGQYHLKVNITIMSFDEGTYQFLSGTKLPVANLEKNLLFVKSLREQGVINELELATVMQEYNFREMPTLVRRCIEEFGADVVRVRPYQQWGAQDAAMEWFFDMRNPMHPYYAEYKRIMQEPIMQHPKVWKWANNLPSESGIHPFYRVNAVADLYERMFGIEACFEKINAYGTKRLDKDGIMAVYGLGRIGKLLLQKGLEAEVVLDQFSTTKEFCGKPIVRPDKKTDLNIQYILITVSYEIPKLKERLMRIYGLGEGQVEYISEVLDRIK